MKVIIDKKVKEKRHFIKIICMSFSIIIALFILSCIGLYIYIYIKAPEFKTELLYKKESSNIYDANNELISTIGSQKRQLVTYDEIPSVLIDAIIATEDSRYFNHDGLDIPRFLKAGFGYLNNENYGGASTITMQVSKNTFTSSESSGIDGIIRKFTDIYLSIFKIEKDYSKEEIIEFYVNAPYLGSGSYGIKQAIKTYFNKDIQDINLAEASIIAGLFQSPSLYDPNINPSLTDERKNEVIDLMLRHGYITNTLANTVKNTKTEDIIVSQNDELNPYQGFIDTVVQEVIDKTGHNPYETSMDIYSTMIQSKQDVINDFYNNYKFKDKKVQVGISVIDNDTGSIIAVGAGRNKTSEMSFNYATQIKRHPGSTAKPLFDYAPGIEYNNWSTYTPFIDKPVRYTNGGIMHNIGGAYQGFLTLEQCLIRSRNTCALQAFKKVKNSKINRFVTTLGITPEYLGSDYYINEAHSIGGFTGVSPSSLASAYSAFGNNGYYIESHSVNKIIYKETQNNKEVVYNYERVKAMKESTAYMISYILKKATSASVKVKNTDIATKTGTSSYDDATLRRLGLSKNVIQDSWTVTFSPDYTIAIWYGYDKLTKKYYNTTSHAMKERIKIQKRIVTNIMENNSKFKAPSGIVVSKVVVGSNPAELPNSNTPKSKIQTHLFLKGTQPTKVSTKSYSTNITTQENKTESNNKIELPNILNP